MSRLMIRLAAVAGTLAAASAQADIRLPAVIGDNMVLQQEMPIAIWGWAAAGEQVTVTLAGKSAAATAGPGRIWRRVAPTSRSTRLPTR